LQQSSRQLAMHVKSVFATLVFILILLVNQCLSQQLAFNHFSVESGLSQSAALTIAQDAQGFIWVGTRGGLNKYDTRGFTVYKNNPADSSSISNNYILSSLGDSKGTLWIGTRDGLNKYNPQNESFDRLGGSAQKNNGFTGHSINCIFEDSKKNIWIGTNNGLNLLVDRDKNVFQAFLQSPPAKVRYDINAITEDHLGNLWLGTTNGLLKINPKKDFSNPEIFRHEAGKSGSLADNYIMALLTDAQQNLWIGTLKNGLDRLNKDGFFTHYTHNNANTNSLVNDNVRKLVPDNKGNIWIGTQEGLSIFSSASNIFTNYTHDPDDKKSLSQNSIHSIFKDTNGTMWVGTFFGGVNIVYSNAFQLYQNNKRPNSLSNNVISSMVEDVNHNLWIGTEGGGLNYFDHQTNNFTHYKNMPGDSNSLPSNLIKVVYGDKSGRIWVGTNAGGLCVFNASTNRFSQFKNVNQTNPANISGSEIVAMQQDSRQRIWMGAQSGLTYINSQAASTINRTIPAPFTLPNTDVHYLLEDSQRNLWIGTAAGLHVLTEKTQQLNSFAGGSLKKTIQTAFVNCITEDAKGRIWIGTAFGGLAMYNPTKQDLDFYAEKNGLPNNNVLGIVADNQGFLWISTDNGLAKFDIGTKTFKTYTAADGLAGDQFNYNSFLKANNGELLFGGYNGITAFFPNKIENNPYAAPIVFTGLQLFNEPVHVNDQSGLLTQNINATQSLRLKYNQNVFTIDFALLNFTKSEKNKYSHKLEGFDKDCIESATSSASYTNVPPGSYTFWVKGANNDGLWGKPVALKIKVLPPFWLTWWAYLLYILFAAAIVFFVTRFIYLRALIKKEDDLHQVKLNFFTNISHEIRTHLTLIMAPVDKLLDTANQDSFNQQKHQLKNVRTNANRLLKLVSELMDFRKAETNHLKLQVAEYNLVEFLQDIFSSFQSLSHTKNIDASFVHQTDNLPLYFDREQLEKVFFNLLTNAFKFTPEGGKIILALGQKNNEAMVTITDNGRGIAPEYLDKLFNNFFQVADHGLQNTGYGIGLALTKNIVELHKGTIAVESKPATAGESGKTSFSVALPLGKKHIDESLLTAPFTLPVKKFTQEIVSAETIVNDPVLTEKSHTMLIAEDNPGLRQLIKETFEHQFNIIETENGLLGWEQATEQIPDMIVSDVMMPEMDGFTLCGKLKTDERTSHIPVILLTAKSAHTDQISGLENGADIYLTKPFSTKVLELHVRNLLASREKMRLRYSQQILAGTATDTPSEASEAVPYMNPIDKEFLDKMESLTDEYMDDPEFGVDMLCKKVAMSRPVLYKKLKAITNLSVNDFVKSLRLKKAAELLAQKRFTVYEVSYAVGYNDSKYFSREFKKLYGKSPSEYSGVEAGMDEE
jgi:ligand-binding sensor domain-containing protein/signal transduction histidine kinase/CheY-like chemotaxis protein